MADIEKVKIPGTNLELTHSEILAVIRFVAESSKFTDEELFGGDELKDENGHFPVPDPAFTRFCEK